MTRQGDSLLTPWGRPRWGSSLLLAAALVLGCGAETEAPAPTREEAPKLESPAGVASTYSCVMHPQIQSSEPGRCPICGMELVRVDTPSSSSPEPTGGATLELSEQAVALAEIQTTRVAPRPLAVEVRLSGRLEVDERRVREISAYVPGRLERLYVDFTGVEVRAGEPLLEIYSPELVSAQEELLQAVRTARATSESPLSTLRESTAALRNAAREKLRLLGVSERQIEALERTGETQTRVTIPAPLDGVVMHKSGVEGMYVQTGTHIYSVADLSQLWAQLDAYESDLPWLRVGQSVEFTTQALPGTSFEGRVAFIDPVVDARSRTVRVRVDVPNPSGRLKPGMYVRAALESQLDTEEVPLAIPASAPLLTGRRAVVYVRDPDARTPSFEGREVVLGPRAGDWYAVVSGLREGELVVSQGAFKIDSALQIQAKPSMMLPDATLGTPPPGHDHSQHGMP